MKSTSYWRLWLASNGDAMAMNNRRLVNLSKGSMVKDYVPPLPKVFARIGPVGEDSLLVAIGADLYLAAGEEIAPLRVEAPLGEAEVLCILRDEPGNLWLGTRNGALHLQGPRIISGALQTDATTRVLPGVTVTRILEDHEHNIWMTSSTDGAFLFTNVAAVTYCDAAGNLANEVHADRKGVVWVGFDKGSYGRMEAGAFTLYQIPQAGGGRGRCVSIFEDRDGVVFLAGDNRLMAVGPGGWTKTVALSIKALAQNSGGTYLAAGARELHVLPPGLEARAMLDTLAENTRASRASIKLSRCTSMKYLSDDSLLLGTLTGLQVLVDGKIAPMPGGPEVAVSDIEVLAGGKVIWISTFAEGAGYVRDGCYHPLRQSDGLASDICHDVAVDPDGKVYVATQKGISEVTGYGTGKWQVRNFGKHSGLASEDVRSLALHDGKLYAATSKGLTVLALSDLDRPVSPRPLRAHAVTSQGKSIAAGGGRLALAPDDNAVVVEFACIAFKNAQDLQYSYRLDHDGAPGPWKVTTAKKLELQYLVPGRYDLHIKAEFLGHPGSASLATFHFEVLSIWSWWRIAGLALLVSGASMGIFWWILQRIKARERKKAAIRKRIGELEHTALRAQMNPHFIFNSLNSIERFYIQDRAEEANTYIADFSELIRAILDLSAKPSISLKEELRLVELYLKLESHRMRNRFTYNIESRTHSDLLMVPPLILQPFVENAVWHGLPALQDRVGHISILVEETDLGTAISITDNGIGRRRSAELQSQYRRKHRSSGIRITRERFELLNLESVGSAKYVLEILDLEDASPPGTGTQVRLFLPHPSPSLAQ